MYYQGKGDYRGVIVDDSSSAIEQDGFSLFSEFKFNTLNSTLFVRYDFFHYTEYYVPDEKNVLLSVYPIGFLKIAVCCSILIIWNQNEIILLSSLPLR
jgi:hypothetical protein